MPHPLEQRLIRLRRRLRRLVAVHGLSRVVAVVLGAVIVLGLCDQVIHFQDPGVRLMCSLAAGGLAVWACARYLVRPLAVRPGVVDLARRAERRFPALGDRLTTAVEFLGQAEDDPTAGSPALRRAAVARAAAAAEKLDFGDVLDPRPVRRAVIDSLAVCLAAAVLVVLDPTSCRIALARLSHPFGSTVWPQVTHLALRRPVPRVARGQAFEVEVIDAFGARLPAEVRIHYRFAGPDGTFVHETERMRPLGAAVVARRESVARPFDFRVEGGDDQTMPWSAVEVVDPPAVQSLAVRLVPPAYTGWPAYEAEQQIRGLVGTRIQMEGVSTKALVSAELCFEGGRRVPARLTDPHHFQVPAPPQELVVEKSESFWFALVDREGLSNTDAERREIRAVPDAPPGVVLEEPGANLFVAPGASVPVRATVKDDLAIRRAAIAYGRSDRPGRQAAPIPIFEGPSEPPHAPPAAVGELGPGESRALSYRWDLAPLRLAPGTAVTFAVTADDYRGATGRSPERRISVITADELQERLAGRQAMILAELARVLAMQRQCRSQVAAIAARLREPAALEQADIDHLQAAALGQRQVDRTLSGRSDGVSMHVRALLSDLDHNRLDLPEVRRRMERLLAEIGRLEREHLPGIAEELTAAMKEAQIAVADGRTGPEPAVARAVAAAAGHQDAVAAAVEQLLGQLGQWDIVRRLQRDLAQLLRDQEELGRRTAELAGQTVARELRDLLPQQLADLRLLARSQLELAIRLEQSEGELRQSGARLARGDPSISRTLLEAAEEASRRALSPQMRAVRDEIERNQMGRALQGQNRTVADLRAVLEILARGGTDALAGLAESVQRLHDRQQELLKDTASLEQLRRAGPLLPDAQDRLGRLAPRQHSLQEETAELGRTVAGHGAMALALGAAGEEMGRAAEMLVRRETGQSAQQAQRGAARRLAFLLEALRPEQLGEQDPAATGRQSPRPQPQTRQLLAELKLVKLLQEDLNARTRQAQESGAGAPSAAQRLAGLAEEQGGLAKLLVQLARELQEHHPIVSVAQQMHVVQVRLSGGDAGPQTQAAQQQIVADLDGLIEEARKGGQAGSTSQQAAGSSPKPGQEPDESKPGSPKAGPQPGTPGPGPTVPQTRPSDPAQVRRLIQELWGELPAAERQRLVQQLEAERFLPKYETLIEAYFLRLAEEAAKEER